MNAQIDAQAELAMIRERRAKTRHPTYRKSRLARYRADLVSLRKSGASYPEIAIWLRQKKRVKVAHTTVMRYLSQLPELSEESASTEA